VHLMTLEPAEIGLSTKFPKSHINIGSGEEISIHDLAILIKRVVGFTGEVVFDRAKPDGTPRKLLDSTLIHQLGWFPAIDLHEGLHRAYSDFLRILGEKHV